MTSLSISSPFVLARSLSSPNKQAFLVLGNEGCFFPSLSYHFRTFSIAAITRLMSSFALLRVSARTDLPDIAAVGIIFLKLAGSSDTMQTLSRAHRRGSAPAPTEGGERSPQLHCEERRSVSLLCDQRTKRLE